MTQKASMEPSGGVDFWTTVSRQPLVLDRGASAHCRRALKLCAFRAGMAPTISEPCPFSSFWSPLPASRPLLHRDLRYQRQGTQQHQGAPFFRAVPSADMCKQLRGPARQRMHRRISSALGRSSTGVLIGHLNRPSWNRDEPVSRRVVIATARHRRQAPGAGRVRNRMSEGDPTGRLPHPDHHPDRATMAGSKWTP